MTELTEDAIVSAWKSTEIILSISCITYNHSKYIEKTLDGFLTQRTNFAFEVLIHDDCSTDGTTEIIKEYEKRFPRIIKPIYESENQYQNGKPSGSAVWNFPRANGKYLAMCEGDDYWIDTDKIQKQVDFLEKHPDYCMCYTKIKLFYQDKQKFRLRSVGKKTFSYEDIFLNGSKINTLTSCFRKDIYLKYFNEIQPTSKDWLMGDLPMWLYFIKNGQIKFIPKVTGVYRVLGESASHSTDANKMGKFRQSSHDIRTFFSNIYSEQQLLSQYEKKCSFLEAVKTKNRKLAIEKWKELSRSAKDFKSYVLLLRTML